ncbi:MAG: ATP-binding cassette domain-containing protein, partial [Eubacteriales bacterium]
MAIFEIENLSFTYAGAKKPSLSGVTMNIERGSFTAVCGATGSGKSTLLRMLKRELRPQGHMTGEVRYNGVALDKLDDRTAACSIGFVMQRPEQQLVTDRVWHELAFGLENMGV